MYPHNSRQVSLFDQPEMFGNLRLKKDNRWIKYAHLIPWERVEDEYRKNFTGKNGEPAKPARVALGCLLIKELMQLSDRETVESIRENPYMQYFLGYSEYQYDLALDPSLLTHFRKRLPADFIGQVNRWIIEASLQSEEAKESDHSDDDSNDGEHGHGEDVAEKAEETPKTNKGTLILDATCAPQDIQYPTDVRLLHESRLKLEEMMDTLQRGRDKSKPRSYRERANKNYKRFCRNRRLSRKKIRKALRAQLQYVARDLKHVQMMKQDSKTHLSPEQERYLQTIQQLYEQQNAMYRDKKHHIKDRIVSIHQPYVRPIVRGKLTAKVEFGAKITVSSVDGFAEVTTLSWDAYNESQDLIPAAEAYKERYGYYPDRILADQIFRNRENRQYCKEHNIHINGRPLGRPSKDEATYRAQIELERAESGERNAIEGKFGEAKRRYGLDRIMTRLQGTSETQIQLVFLVMNLKKILRDLFIFFFNGAFGLFEEKILQFFTQNENRVSLFDEVLAGSENRKLA